MKFSADTPLRLEESTLEKCYVEEPDTIVLDALARLFSSLNQAGLRYCHWKGNRRLVRKLNGLSDLDLLVDRGHSQNFRRILLEHNSKSTLASPGREQPGVEHYLGFDPSSGNLYHLHVYYHLFLDEKNVMNYQLPFGKTIPRFCTFAAWRENSGN